MKTKAFFIIPAMMMVMATHAFARQTEKLSRGLVAVRENPSAVTLSWRYLSSDPMNTAFNIYRNGKKIGTTKSDNATFFRDDYKGNDAVTYTVEKLIGRKATGEKYSYTLPANAPTGYIDIPLDMPQGGVTPAGDNYTYTANDASIGDVDGDGDYEIILNGNRQTRTTTPTTAIRGMCSSTATASTVSVCGG